MQSSVKISLFIVCFAILAAVPSFGQGRVVQPGELNQLIAFYEWALEAKFTPDQRERYQALIESESKKHPDTVRSNIDTLLAAWSKISSADEATRERLRGEFLVGYLPELRQSSDERKVFLFSIYDAAHSGRNGVAGSDSVAGKGYEQASSGDSTSLIGKWERHTGSGSITDGTGKTKYGNGTTFTFEFRPGGAVSYTSAEKTLSMMGCKIETIAKASGKFTVTGNSLDIDLGMLNLVGSDSCDGAGNYQRSKPAGTLSHTFVVKPSDSVFRPDKPVLLCFDGEDGACFEKVPS